MSRWVVPLVLMFSFSLLGLGIGLLIGSLIPLWLLLGFAFVYSAERWLRRITVKKIVGIPYKIALNLCILSMLGLLIWSGIKLFSVGLASSPLTGSLVLISEVILFVWLLVINKRNGWRWPSVKLTTFPLVCLSLIFAFAGVQPLSDYKDSFLSNFSSKELPKVARPSIVEIPPPTIKPPTVEPPTPLPTPVPTTKKLTTEDVEREAFNSINKEREKEGLRPTVWDDNLYRLSIVHTEEMADKKELFHTPIGASYGENAWGASWGGVSKSSLANKIVASWMSSPLHRAWILHVPLRTSVVSIVDDKRGQYASWSFWTKEAGEGPPLVKKAYKLWMSETGGRTPWLTWLYDVKGYPSNIEWLIPSGVTEEAATEGKPPDGTYVCRELVVSSLTLRGDLLELGTLNASLRTKFKIEYLDNNRIRLTDAQGKTGVAYLEYKEDFQCILFKLNEKDLYVSAFYRE